MGWVFLVVTCEGQFLETCGHRDQVKSRTCRILWHVDDWPMHHKYIRLWGRRGGSRLVCPPGSGWTSQKRQHFRRTGNANQRDTGGISQQVPGRRKGVNRKHKQQKMVC